MKQKNHIKLYGLFILILFAIGIGTLFFDMSFGYAYKNEERVFQVLAGNKFYHEPGTKFIYTKNGTSYIGADQNEYLSDSPIYMEGDSECIVLSNDQIYVNGSTAKFAKVEAFHTFDHRDGLHYNGSQVNGGFLFNGRNAYLFLEDMTLSINGKHIETGPFTYVERNDDTYVVYDVSKDYMEAGKLHLETVEAKGRDYMVDLTNDIFTDSSGKDILIFMNVTSLDELK